MHQNSSQEVLTQAVAWLRAGRGVELVTVVRTWGSSPRPAGSMAAVRDDGAIVGSVSGGCVERELAEAHRAPDGEPEFNPGDRTARVTQHSITDDEARRFGLSCGGQIDLLFESLVDPEPLQDVLHALERRERVCRTVTLAADGASDVPTVTLSPATASDSFSFDGQTLRQIIGPSWRLLLIGAGQLSRFTAEFARAVDFDVMVCEPRPPYRDAWPLDDLPLLDELPDDAVRQFAPDTHSAVLALTHDPALDDLALLEALPGKSFYIGALGSRGSHAKREQRLLAQGLSEADFQRLHGPVGLSIGSRTSAEIAISIIAEMVAERASHT